jgi:hypothetical protein
VRIDHCPLPRPVTAYSFAPVDMAPFHAVCPNDIFVQRCELIRTCIVSFPRAASLRTAPDGFRRALLFSYP